MCVAAEVQRFDAVEADAKAQREAAEKARKAEDAGAEPQASNDDKVSIHAPLPLYCWLLPTAPSYWVWL